VTEQAEATTTQAEQAPAAPAAEQSSPTFDADRLSRISSLMNKPAGAALLNEEKPADSLDAEPKQQTEAAEPEAAPEEPKASAPLASEKLAEEIAARREADRYKQQLAEIEPQRGLLDRMKSDSIDDRLAALDEAGVSIDDLVTHLIENPKAEPLPDDPRIIALQKELEDLKGSIAQREEQARNEIAYGEIRAFAAKGGDRWSEIQTVPGFEQDVAEYIKVLRDQGQPVSYESACDELEALLRVRRGKNAAPAAPAPAPKAAAAPAQSAPAPAPTPISNTGVQPASLTPAQERTEYLKRIQALIDAK
jgi:hypothetical protein